MNTIEQTVKFCRKCQRKTIHVRPAKAPMGTFVIFINLALAFVTYGLWFVIMFFYWLGNIRINGWTCQVCGSIYNPVSKITKDLDELNAKQQRK